MKRNAYFAFGVFAGSLLHAAIVSFRQDWIGKEAYLESVRSHWADATTTVPVAVAMVLVVLGTLVFISYNAAVDERNDKPR